MKLQQLRFLVEVVDSGLNVTQASERLFTSQPGVSKQVRLLEDELGFSIFERSGKRFTALTRAGAQIVDAARRVLMEADNFKWLSDDLRDDQSGSLVIATTHTQARYVLPQVVAEFIRRFPKVRLSIREGDPRRVADMLLRGEADIGIATEALATTPGLASFPAYRWNHCLIVPAGHPLLAEAHLSLKSLAAYPLITYDAAFSGRTRLDDAFARAGVVPNLVLTAVDADVIKTYVSLGLGVGIIAEMAAETPRDGTLETIPVGHLFGTNTTRLGIRQGAQPRHAALVFAEILSPNLTADVLLAASVGDDGDFAI